MKLKKTSESVFNFVVIMKWPKQPNFLPYSRLLFILGNLLFGSCSDSSCDLLMLEGHAKDVLMVVTFILHRLDELASLVAGHGSRLFKYALEGSADICCHGDVTTHIEVASFIDELVDNLICILLQQVLNIGLCRGESASH